MPECDVCLAPHCDGPWVEPGYLVCFDCWEFTAAAGHGFPATADFLELCRAVDSNSRLKSEQETDGEMSPAWLESLGITVAPPPAPPDPQTMRYEDFVRRQYEQPGFRLSGVKVAWPGEAEAAAIERRVAEEFYGAREVEGPELIPIGTVGLLVGPAPEGTPAVAGAILPPPPAPDPSEPADPEANVLRVFQWPPHCGQWFVRIGSPNDRRSIQYGPLRSPTEVLEQFVGHLAARKYRFDGGYTPPAE